jgi:hypothetical protein
LRYARSCRRAQASRALPPDEIRPQEALPVFVESLEPTPPPALAVGKDRGNPLVGPRRLFEAGLDRGVCQARVERFSTAEDDVAIVRDQRAAEARCDLLRARDQFRLRELPQPGLPPAAPPVEEHLLPCHEPSE